MKDKPTAIEQEWTAESVRKLFDYAYTNEIMDSLSYIADVHNAALAAERKGHEMDGQLISSQESEIQQLQQILNSR